MPSKQMGMNVGRQETIYLYQRYLLRAGFPAGNIQTALCPGRLQLWWRWCCLANSAGLILKNKNNVSMDTRGHLLAPFNSSEHIAGWAQVILITSPIPVWIWWGMSQESFPNQAKFMWTELASLGGQRGTALWVLLNATTRDFQREFSRHHWHTGGEASWLSLLPHCSSRHPLTFMLSLL